MSGITIRTGTEGPRFDPYSYQEITVRLRKRLPVTIHIGLSIWMRVGRQKMAEGDEVKAAQMFEKRSGYSVTSATRILRKAEEAKYRRHRYHGGMEWGNGYPGESVCTCLCGEIIDYHFDRSAIE